MKRSLILAFLVLGLLACNPNRHGSKPLAHRAAITDETPGAAVQPGLSNEWSRLEFEITDFQEKQRLLVAPPWHASGGDWIFVTCRLRSARNAEFVLGMELSRASAFGKSVILPTSNGDVLLGKFANLLEQTTPPNPGRTQPLQPLTQGIVILGIDQKRDGDSFHGKGGPWTTSKWFLERNGRYAEVYVNFNFDEGFGEFSEKDPDYREDLLRQLAWALRDGPPLPRTPQDDKNLVEEGPRFVRRVKLTDRLADEAVFDSATLFHVLVRTPQKRSRLSVRRVNAPAAEVVMWDDTRRLESASCGATPLAMCVVEEVVPRREGAISSDDPKKIWLLHESRAPRQLSGKWNEDSTRLASGALSPDGGFVALEGIEGSAKSRRPVVYVHEIATGKTVTLDMPADGLSFRSWNHHGELLVESGSYWEKNSHRALYAATPRSTTLRKMSSIDDLRVASPDGLQSFSIDEERGALVMLANSQGRTFKFHPDDKGMASNDTCHWVGNRYVLFDGDRPAFIDTATLKMNFAMEPGLHGGASNVSDDGRYVLYVTNEGVSFAEISISQ